MNKSTVVGLVIAVIVIAGVGMFALGGSKSDDMGAMDMNSDTNSESADSSMVAPNTVIMDDLEFQQEEITIKKGETVTWKNMDKSKHNVVFDDESVGKVEDSKLISMGEELKFTFEEVGEFTYFCEPHPFMKAKIIVTE